MSCGRLSWRGPRLTLRFLRFRRRCRPLHRGRSGSSLLVPFGARANLPLRHSARHRGVSGMATIVGGIATSHTPTIGFALDTNKQQDPVWAPIFKGYEPVQRWLAEKKPDVLFFIFNDHVTSFFFDHYSHFALGVGDRYWVADEGGGPRKLPPISGP